MEEIAVCLIVNDNYYKTRYVIENLFAKTSANIKLYIFNNASEDKRIVDYCNALIQIKDGVYKEVEQKVSVSKAYNILLQNLYQKYVVFFPVNYIVSDNWLEDLLVSVKTVENAGCVGIRSNNEKVHLCPLTHKNITQPEDDLYNVWVTENNLVEGLLIFDSEKIEVVGHLDENNENNGYELFEYSFRFTSQGYKNYYIRKQIAQKIDIDSEILFPKKTESSFKIFKSTIQSMIKTNNYKKYHYEKSC